MALMAVACALGAPAARAADAAASEVTAANSNKATEVGAIVVTARLRKELLSETPAVVQAITGSTLLNSGITDLSHIDLLAPTSTSRRASCSIAWTPAE